MLEIQMTAFYERTVVPPLGSKLGLGLIEPNSELGEGSILFLTLFWSVISHDEIGVPIPSILKSTLLGPGVSVPFETELPVD